MTTEPRVLDCCSRSATLEQVSPQALRRGVTTAEHIQLGMRAPQLCNAAVQGTPVPRDEAEAVIDISVVPDGSVPTRTSVLSL